MTVSHATDDAVSSHPISQVGIVGLGYVGLPLALAFGRVMPTLGFDINPAKVEAYQRQCDPTGEQSQADFQAAQQLTFTTDASELARCQQLIVAVPTPITSAKLPDLAPLEQVSALIGQHMRPDTLVIFESTVYPGVTEEICGPILAQFGKPFRLGYSPERVNPGDKQRPLTEIVKIVSGEDPVTLAEVSALYQRVITAGVHEAPSIKVAEAAKILENTQRDVNIALMNEFALICQRLQIDTTAVLEAAGTKWNFLKFHPGLVGGHCIGVDPYYLTYRAQQVGLHADLMVAARQINDSMGFFIAQQCVKQLCQHGVDMRTARVLILGLTFKENCADTRNTRVIDIIQELQSYGVTVEVVDPVADQNEAVHEYGLHLQSLKDCAPAHALIVAVAHDAFRKLSLNELRKSVHEPALLFDVKALFDTDAVAAAGFKGWRL